MKTKTIDKLIAICYEPNVDMALVINYLMVEKQRKEQKKVKQSAKERLAYANGIALGIATNYTLNEKKNIMDNARSKAAIYFSTKPMEFVPILPDLTKDLERLSKAIEGYNEAVKKQPKPSTVDCINVMIEQVKNNDYKPNIIQFIEDKMIIEMQITDNKVTLKRKN